jgi:hypothetical protein
MKEGAIRARREGSSGPFSRTTEILSSWVKRARERVEAIPRAATATDVSITVRGLPP